MAMRTAAFLSAIKKGAQFIFQSNPGKKIYKLRCYQIWLYTCNETVKIYNSPSFKICGTRNMGYAKFAM